MFKSMETPHQTNNTIEMQIDSFLEQFRTASSAMDSSSCILNLTRSRSRASCFEVSDGTWTNQYIQVRLAIHEFFYNDETIHTMTVFTYLLFGDYYLIIANCTLYTMKCNFWPWVRLTVKHRGESCVVLAFKWMFDGSNSGFVHSKWRRFYGFSDKQ